MEKKLVEKHVADLYEESYTIDELYKEYKGCKIAVGGCGDMFIFTLRLETDEEFEKRKKSMETAKK